MPLIIMAWCPCKVGLYLVFDVPHWHVMSMSDASFPSS